MVGGGNDLAKSKVEKKKRWKGPSPLLLIKYFHEICRLIDYEVSHQR